ncbi:MAG: hypothetical protein FK733_12875 [Asgard group archaeon]|nr:hypothetical protein [Asgard group archaeon]
MSFILGLLISLVIIYPSFMFIHILIVEGTTLQVFFNNFLWEDLAAICKTAIFGPINVFFNPADPLMIAMAFLPWVVTAFVVSFFLRKKNAARGGLSLLTSFILSAAVYYDYSVEGTAYDMSLLTSANIFYGFLVVTGVTTIIGLLSGLISPFKKDGARRRRRVREPRISDDEGDVTGPYYMPTESPSRDQYMQTQTTTSVDRTRPHACEYCGSYLDADSEFCSVCGNRVFDEY